uniref:Reverse transcriptase domain-containing protein n=1 Tax=Anolis carolinensis TaxID=28377 RepID=A0A803THX2_ANOCA
MPMDRMKDKSNPTVKDKNNNITELNRIMNKWGLKDSWRLLKGDERKYTYYSAVHKTYTRIDYLFISKNMVDKLISSEIGIIRISDHAIVNLEIINKQDYEQTRRWRLNSNILNYEEIIRRIGANWQEIWDINDNNVSRNILWDTMKAVARGLCIKETYNLKKRQERKNKLEKDIEKLEKQYIIKRTTQIYNELRAKKEELDKIEIDEVQKNLIYLKREFFEYSNKNSKMLARAAQKKKMKNEINAVRDKSGNICRLMKDKLKIFEELYKELYQAGKCSKGKIHKYVKTNWTVKIEETDRELLEAPIKKEEIEQVIRKLKIGKAPGPDGLGPEYYKTFEAMITPKLLELFNAIMDGERIPGSWKQSLTILLPKPKKDLTDPGSYRPISLINQDAKILTAIITNRMSNFMYKYIKQDQCGFVKGRQMSNLIGRVINKIQTIEGEKNKAGILALDIFKAFDSVEWPTIQTIMNKFGLGKRFKNIMSQLYSDNYTKIILNDGITGEIKVTRGTRQRCPMSPILFAMVMELLANVIRKDKELEGIGTKLGKISLFADDTLITIKEIMKKMEIIKKHLTAFEWATGLKINWNKSEAMLFNYTKQEEEEFKKQMDIKDMRISVKENIKYLGIIITKDLKSIERKNLEELRKHMEVKLKDYNNLRLSWFGRIALVKMKVLPKINFLFRMIPLMISEKEINKWQQMINKYCNNGKKNRLNK